MRRFFSVLVISGLILGGVPMFARAQAADIASLKAIIESLQAQITTLQTQISALKSGTGTAAEVKTQAQAIGTTARAVSLLVRELERGAQGEDVSLIQELLATDPDIYPEALVTGYYGALTEKAVKQFQKKLGVEQVGRVGPKTLRALNMALEGLEVSTSTTPTATSTGVTGLLRNVTVGNPSGKVPPGLLISPGIRAKLGFAPQPLPGQILPPGIAKKLGGATSTPPVTPTSTDVTAPVISGVTATTTQTSALVSWTTNEPATSKVWHHTTSSFALASGTPMVSDATLVTVHGLTISGLATSSTHYFVVESMDAVGNTSTSSQGMFVTLP